MRTALLLLWLLRSQTAEAAQQLRKPQEQHEQSAPVQLRQRTPVGAPRASLAAAAVHRAVVTKHGKREATEEALLAEGDRLRAQASALLLRARTLQTSLNGLDTNLGTLSVKANDMSQELSEVLQKSTEVKRSTVSLSRQSEKMLGAVATVRAEAIESLKEVSGVTATQAATSAGTDDESKLTKMETFVNGLLPNGAAYKQVMELANGTKEYEGLVEGVVAHEMALNNSFAIKEFKEDQLRIIANISKIASGAYDGTGASGCD